MVSEKKTLFGFREVLENEKKGLVNGVFSSVAPDYDLMNDLMSFFTHRLWKRFLVEKTGIRQGQSTLDVAGGTADISLLLKEKAGEDGKVVVYDINQEMLEHGRDKCLDRGLVKDMMFVRGNAEELPFPDNTFHCATVGFGIRNVTRIGAAFKEMARVVKPGGRVLCLEFSHPKNKILKELYDFYSFNVIPVIGETVTGNRGAYVYLAESIRKFPHQEELKKIMEEAGLYKVKYHNLFDGIAAVHVGTKV
ncbi:MAG: bifunctional demethylmenaquinone methyltransferase/2-methoxy-6-polyprenyl-1,4-benzoquinol methylase UbiE [Thermodesulfobacteriota bacterium]